MPLSRSLVAKLAIALSIVSTALPGQAQNVTSFPDRVVRLVLPYPPGGSTDTIARHIAQKLTADWGQTVIVDNKPGASGMIGTEAVAHAPPDGYTALFAITQHIQNPMLFAKVPYDPIKDFVPIARILTVPTALAVSADVPVKNIKELLDLIRSQPGKHSYGSTGTASTSHIYGGLLDKTAKLNAVHVPYKGAGPMLTDLLGRQITFTIVDVGSLMPHVKAGKLKLLAVSGTERVDYLKDVPTFAEAGISGFEALSWMGIFLPVNTPAAIQQKWATALQGYMTGAEFAGKLAPLGMAPNYLSPRDFGSQLARDIPVWRTMITTANVKAE